MTLLKEIQNSAVDSKSDLPSLLRKCRILAARLKNEEFKNWVTYELDGYPNETLLPNYRKMSAQSFGHFNGPFGSGLRNAPIPMMCIPKEFREFVSTVKLFQGVSSLQNLICKEDHDSLQEQWPADLIALVARRIYEKQNLAQAWKDVPASFIVGILDTVRNRILNFVLEIESSAPDAGEGTLTPDLTSDKVANVFNTYIMGNFGNVAAGSSHVDQQLIINVSSGDWNKLAEYLQTIGLSVTDIGDLKTAVNAEPTVSNNKFGSKVASWIGKMVSKSAQGLWNVSTSVASDLLAKVLAKYYGLPDA